MSKEKKLTEKLAGVTKEVKETLRNLEKQAEGTLKELEKLRPEKGEAAKSIEEMRKSIEGRIDQLHSLIDKYVADTHVTRDLKSDFKKLGDQLPELMSKLQESVEKQAASIYADRIKRFADSMKSSLRRLREKIGY